MHTTAAAGTYMYWLIDALQFIHYWYMSVLETYTNSAVNLKLLLVRLNSDLFYIWESNCLRLRHIYWIRQTILGRIPLTKFASSCYLSHDSIYVLFQPIPNSVDNPRIALSWLTIINGHQYNSYITLFFFASSQSLIFHT